MSKKRVQVPQKIRATLQQEIDSECPFCTSREVGHFEVHHVDENPENNDPSNLLMVCRMCHSKITKGDISQTETLGVKRTLLKYRSTKVNPILPQSNTFHGIFNQPVVGNNNRVIINVKKQSKKTKYPVGCIGANIEKANYISYLITRYHKYKEWQVSKENMNYAIFQSQIKRKYKIGKTRSLYHIPDSKFEGLMAHVHKRIDGTVLANVKRSKGELKNYLNFEEYLNEIQT